MSGGVLPSRELGGDLLNGVGQNRGENRAGRFIGRDPSPAHPGLPRAPLGGGRVIAIAGRAVGRLQGRTQRFGRSRIGEERALDADVGLVLFEVRQARPCLGALLAAACTVDERRVRSDDHVVMLVRLRPGDARLIGAVGRAVDSSEESRRARADLVDSGIGGHRSLASADLWPQPVLGDEALRETDKGAHLLPRGVEAPLRFAAPCVEVALVLLESARAEERAQERLPLLSRREEEPGELVLREQDHLLELLSSEPEHLAEGEADIARLSGAPDPHAVDELLELGAGGFGGEASTALRGTVVLGSARDPPTRVADGELEAHLGRVGEEAVVAAPSRLGTLVARHAAVQSEAHPVENARLACARAPRDEEDAVAVERVEVDALRLTERSEPGQLERVELHVATGAARRATSSRSARSRAPRTSRTSSASRSDAPSPARTWTRNASTRSASLRAARTRCV